MFCNQQNYKHTITVFFIKVYTLRYCGKSILFCKKHQQLIQSCQSSWGQNLFALGTIEVLWLCGVDRSGRAWLCRGSSHIRSITVQLCAWGSCKAPGASLAPACGGIISYHPGSGDLCTLPTKMVPWGWCPVFPTSLTLLSYMVQDGNLRWLQYVVYQGNWGSRTKFKNPFGYIYQSLVSAPCRYCTISWLMAQLLCPWDQLHMQST